MAFALQYMDRPNGPSGTVYGGYCINDGTNTVFIETRGMGNLTKVYEWLGNGDRAKGIDTYRSTACLSLPSVTINASQYNALVTTIPTETQKAFTKGDC